MSFWVHPDWKNKVSDNVMSLQRKCNYKFLLIKNLFNTN